MTARRKLPAEAEVIPCFSCHRVMIPVGPHGGWCEYCLVSEYRGDTPSHTRIMRNTSWNGTLIEYLDHSRGHFPSPA